MRTLSIFQIHTIVSLFVSAFGTPLQTDVIPKEYNLEIITNLGDEDDTFNFKGRVSITIECINATSTITMHSKDLKVDTEKVTLKSDDKGKEGVPTVVAAVLKPEEEFLVILLSEVLKAERRYTIDLHFEGELGENLVGYYRTSYLTEEEETKWLALTNFKPYYARTAFPCFDEPSLTADKFSLSLGRSEKYTSISNMPLERTEMMENKPGWEWDRYSTLESVPTWVTAFAVTDFSYVTIDIPRDNDTAFPVNLWTRGDALNQLEYASEIIPKFLKFLWRYLNVPASIPKSDIIAAPELCSPGMSYHGLITIREEYLLFDQEKSPIVKQESIAIMVAYELAHHWFGNVAIPRWWTDLWLIDGIAKYLTEMALSYVYPKWKFARLEITDDNMEIFHGDSMQRSLPLLESFTHPVEIEQSLNSFETRKGSYIIRMVSHFLSAKIFLNGIHTFMQTNPKSITHIDKNKLFAYMTEEAHRSGLLDATLNTQTIIENWISKPGIPLITVVRDYKRGTAKVKQERFFRNRELLGTGQTKWWVPLTYTTECGLAFNNTKVDIWLAPDAESVTITGFRGLVDWVIFNLEASGLYMVNYDNENWDFIIRYMRKPTFKLIPTLNRVHLIASAANLAWVGRIPYVTFFKLLDYLQLEDEFLPWRVAIRCLNELEALVKNTRIYAAFLEFARRIMYPVYFKASRAQLKKVSTLEEIHHVVQVTTSACKFQMSSCTNTVVQHLENLREHIFHKSDVTWSNDLHEVFYCNSIKNGSRALWDTMLVHYNKTDKPAMKRTALKALGCSTNHTLLRHYLELALNETHIRKLDIPTVFTAVLSMRDGIKTVKGFLEENIQILYDTISPQVKDLSTIMIAVAQYTSTFEGVTWLERFFAEHDEYFKEIKDDVDRAVEVAKLNLQWHSENYESFEKYIRLYVMLPAGIRYSNIIIDS